MNLFTKKLIDFLHVSKYSNDFQEFIFSLDFNKLSKAEQEIYLQISTCNFDSSFEVQEKKSAIRSWLKTNTEINCPCTSWEDSEIVPMGYETVNFIEDWFDTLREQTQWNSLTQCKICKQYWYVRIDTVDDNYYFKYISNKTAENIIEKTEWPSSECC